MQSQKISQDWCETFYYNAPNNSFFCFGNLIPKPKVLKFFEKLTSDLQFSDIFAFNIA